MLKIIHSVKSNLEQNKVYLNYAGVETVLCKYVGTIIPEYTQFLISFLMILSSINPYPDMDIQYSKGIKHSQALKYRHNTCPLTL